jgi:hypothetical protein
MSQFQSQLRTGFKSTIERGTGLGNPETFQQIVGVRSITVPSLTGETLDSTHHDSPNGVTEQVPAGSFSVSPLSFEIEDRPGDVVHQGILSDFRAQRVANYRITPAGPSPKRRITVRGIVTSWQPSSLARGQGQTISVTITPSGDITTETI